MFAGLSVRTKQRNASHPSHTRFEIHRIAVLGSSCHVGCWVLLWPRWTVDGNRPQRQNSFFVGRDSSGIGQLLSDPVEHITCRVQTVLTRAADEPSRSLTVAMKAPLWSAKMLKAACRLCYLRTSMHVYMPIYIISVLIHSLSVKL